ncbi:MAG TPA: sigma-70 factor domain-containing protein [Candidatus Dormibacteraeota bacterium]|nr:sigma-70 factor domain-containing protein [Candidatus Dormibacteraeota bacterium]
MNPTDAALNRYLQEIGSIPLLTPEEEIQIARKIQRGDAVARERLIQANLRLVVIVARDYINLGLPLLNLILRGKHRINESRGSLRFEKGAKLSTYASWWIKQAIKRALANQGRTIRLPAHVLRKLLTCDAPRPQ